MATFLKEERSADPEGVVEPGGAQVGAWLPGSSARLSKSSRFIVSMSGSKVTLFRNVHPVERVHLFSCIDKIDSIEVSPDERFILCAMFSRNCVQVFSTDDPAWKCRINDGPAGMISAFWAPTSLHVVTESDFGIQLSLWSLVDNSQSVITFPKPQSRVHNAMAGMNHSNIGNVAFSDRNGLMAVVHRIELQDHIGIYSLTPLLEVIKFKARTQDIACIQWLPQDTHIVTIDVPLYYRCAVYSPSGEMMVSYEAYQHALGIRTLGLFTPSSGSSAEDVSSSGLLALGSYDGTVRCLTMYTSWQLALTLPLVHPRELEAQTLLPGSKKTQIAGDAHAGGSFGANIMLVELSRSEHRDLREQNALARTLTLSGRADVTKTLSIARRDENVSFNIPSINNPNTANTVTGLSTRGSVSGSAAAAEDEADEAVYVQRLLKTLPRGTGPLSVSDGVAPAVPSASASAALLPAKGVHLLQWSASGRWLVASEEQVGRCLWVWEPLAAQCVAVLVQQEQVSCVCWRPRTSPGDEEVLAFCCGGTAVYFYTPPAVASPGAVGSVRKVEVVAPQDSGRVKVRRLQWAHDGASLLAIGKDLFCMLHL